VSSPKAAVSERRLPSRLRWLGPAVALAGMLSLQYFRFVLTPSLPRGVYLTRSPHGPYGRGEIVAFCPPPQIGSVLMERNLAAPGLCPGGSVPIAKRVEAIGPIACATPAGLALDGRLFPWPALSKSLPLPRYRGCGPTAHNCAFLFGDTPDSIDSRVFGCIPTRAFLFRLVPLLTERSVP
jgi:type IV secretory pathway protease TraF